MGTHRGTLRREVVEAARDYRYLLDRGYPRKPSLDLVATRYMLSREEKMLLYRCVHSSRDASLVRSKLLSPGRIKGSRLLIDGYNVILTVRAWIKGEPIYLCDDCVVRDLSGVHGRVSYDEDFWRSALLVVSEALSLEPDGLIVFLDKKVSKSGEAAARLRSMMPSRGCSVVTADRNDATIMASKGVAVSSDIVILISAPRIFDLAGYIIRRQGGKTVDLAREIKNPCVIH